MRNDKYGLAFAYQVSKMLINKSHPHPVTKKAPAGGKIIVTRMTIMSEVLTAMSYEYEVLKVLCGAVSARLGV